MIRISHTKKKDNIYKPYYIWPLFGNNNNTHFERNSESILILNRSFKKNYINWKTAMES